MARPDYVKQEHLEFLDDLRESGACNMFGAGPDLRNEFRLDKATSHKILSYWMASFGDKDR